MTRSLVKGCQRDGKYWLDQMLDKRPQEEEEEEYHYQFLKIPRPLPDHLPDHHHRHRDHHHRHPAERPWKPGNRNTRPHPKLYPIPLPVRTAEPQLLLLLPQLLLLPRPWPAELLPLPKPWPGENGHTETLQQETNLNLEHHQILVQVPQNALTNHELQNHCFLLYRGRNRRNHSLRIFLPPLRARGRDWENHHLPNFLPPLR
jgi:hypothetical protein